VAVELRAQSWTSIDPLRAAELLAGLPADGSRLSRAAALLDAAKARDRADEARRRLLIEAPSSEQARALSKHLGGKGVHALIGDDDRRLARVEALLAAHDNAAARDEARILIASGPANRCVLRYVEGKASRKLRRYNEAIASLSKARHECAAAKNDKRMLRSMLLELQVRTIKGHTKSAKALADDFATRFADHSYTDDALLTYANALERKGRRTQAQKVYRRILERYPDGDQVGVAGWRIAFHSIRRGALTKAQPSLQAILASDRAKSRDGARARYWLARSFEGTDLEKAKALFEAAITTPPLTFYAWLALDRLRRIDSDAATAIEQRLVQRRGDVKTSSAAPPLAGEPIFLRASVLSQVGWQDAAAAELALLEAPKMSEDDAVNLALAYAEIEEHHAAQWLLRTRARTALSRFPSQDNLRIWQTAYSRPYQAPLEAAAKAEKLEPLLLLALSREESTFDPAIVSWAGATGLTQLMPATAVGAYATVYRKRLKDFSILTDPTLNLRLGAHVLGDGLRRFGEVPLALAAYNGGPGLARRTLPKGKAKGFDLWVETISVRETRRYVKRVIGTWGRYRFLWGEPFIDLPDHIEPR